MPDVVVVGQVGRDLVLRVPDLPAAGGSVAAGRPWEGLGGKGANQAVALTQLGLGVALVGVVGDDPAAARLGGEEREDAAGTAAAAAALTVGHPGGRPALSPSALAGVLSAHRPT